MTKIALQAGALMAFQPAVPLLGVPFTLAYDARGRRASVVTRGWSCSFSGADGAVEECAEAAEPTRRRWRNPGIRTPPPGHGR